MQDDQHLRIMVHVADTLSALAIFGSLVKALPPVAAFVGIIWYTIQIWESHTVQKWWRLHRKGRRTPPLRHKKRVAKVIQSLTPPL